MAAPKSSGARTFWACRCSRTSELIGAIMIYRQEVRPSLTSRSSWCRTSPRRPSSRSRTRGCSTSCGSAPTILRIAGAADRDRRGAEGHQQLARRSGAGVRGMLENAIAHLRGQVLAFCFLRRTTTCRMHDGMSTRKSTSKIMRSDPLVPIAAPITGPRSRLQARTDRPHSSMS